ncbi:MAG TPA: alpha/beta hydrolase domain-containing protein [Chloroflexota bacterium]|nr:alpha/beta hydrolase domain-containing protein [Chloroflexota bacterium]
MVRQRSCRTVPLCLAALLALLAGGAGAGDCDAAIGPRAVVNGQQVGPERCVIQEEREIVNVHGVPYRRVEMAIDGWLAGFAVTEGPRAEMFTDVPEFALAQRGNTAERFPGLARYSGAKGSGMTIFYPAAPEDWNGLLYVTAHGAGSYAPVGELLPRQPGRYNPLMGANSYVGLMIDKGYAVAYTRRSSAIGPADDEQALLADGRTVGGLSFSYHTGLLRDFTQLAKHFLAERLGRPPLRTYFYGHSAGGSLGRLINYVPGANVDAAGQPLFHGLLIDDAGGGYYLPQLFVDGRDVLFATPEERARFVPQLEVAHQAYTGETGDYLRLKRENLWLLQTKGLGDKVRLYEIAGSSHFDAGRVSQMGPAEAALTAQNLDLSGVFDALIDVLDAWVAQGVEPPPTRSDSYLLGDVDRDGIREHPAVALPEVACPTGVYYVFPEGVDPGRRGTQLTAFAAYDGASLEPLDSRGFLVDMNHNGIRDQRETISQAWQRRLHEGETSGVLAPGETLTPQQYVSCVERAASELVAQRLLSREALAYYLEQAAQSPVGITLR